MSFRRFQMEPIKKEIQLNKYVTVAPLHQSYALCIEYMRHWFIEKFADDFFSFIHLDGAHVFGELAKLDKKLVMQHMKDDKATLTIIPTIDDDYNRDRLDQNLFGVDQFINTTSIDKAFIQDKINNKYLMMKMDMVLMNFTFRIRVPSRAMQLDIQKYMKLAFRTNLSETKDADLDYVIPYPLMLNIAKDLGFHIKDNAIEDPVSMLTYLNSVSYIPITYKRSNVNAREEYFVRVDHLPIRLLIKDVTKDDGNRYGHIQDEFGIEMQVETRFPSMQLYVYFSRDEIEQVTMGKEVYNIDNTLMMSLHYYDDPPIVNDKGWTLYINTQWQADDKDEVIKIDMRELFKKELTHIINTLLRRFTSPSTVIDIQIYNRGKRMHTLVDWDNMTIESLDDKFPSLVSSIAVYVDMQAINTMRLETYNNNNKVQPSDPNRVY